MLCCPLLNTKTICNFQTKIFKICISSQDCLSIHSSIHFLLVIRGWVIVASKNANTSLSLATSYIFSMGFPHSPGTDPSHLRDKVYILSQVFLWVSAWWDIPATPP